MDATNTRTDTHNDAPATPGGSPVGTTDAAGAPQRSRYPAHPRLTASRLELARECPAAFSLPHDRTENPAADKGTGVHSFMEKVLVEGLCQPSDVREPAARALCERLDPAAVYRVAVGFGVGGPEDAPFSGPGELLAEVAFAYDPATGEAREIRGGGHRDYAEAPEGWVCGTADAVFFAAGGDDGEEGAVLVTDWKTGAFAVAPPERNPQLRFLALCAARALGTKTGATPRAFAQVVYVGAEGDLHPSTCEFSERELDGIAADVATVTGAVEEARGVPRAEGPGGPSASFTVGSHCRLCPAFARCPAQAGAAQALLELGEKSEELTPQKAARAWETLQAVEAATKRVRSALTDLVGARGPAPLPGGGELRIVESKREKIDPERAMPLLRDVYGDDADAAATVTKTGLKKLAGKELPAVMERLEVAGAVETSHSESLREVGGKRG